MEHVKVAVLDLGSTSFRLVVAEANAAGRIEPLLRKRTALHLGLAVGREGRISGPHATAAVETVRSFRRCAVRAGAERMLTVATSALRDASNRDKLARRLGAAAGGPVRFLTGREEAALMFAALTTGLGIGEETVLGLDLGGGSLELAVGDGRGPEWAGTLPLGASRLTGRFVAHDPMTRSERSRLRAHVEDVLRPAIPDVLGPRRVRCLAAGGTVKGLARLVAGARGHRSPVDGYAVSGAELGELWGRLAAAGRAKRLRMPGMNPDRADVLGAGAIVVTSLMSLLGLEELTVSGWGLREGIILEALGLVRVPVESPGAPVPAGV